MTFAFPLRPRHRAFLCLALALAMAPPVLAQDAATDITTVSPRVLFAVSGGFWSESAEAAAQEGEPAAGTAAEEGAATEGEAAAAAAPPAQRGFYRLVAIRSADNTSRLYLQQVALSADGPEVAVTTELAEISDLSAYVTDIRTEDAAEAPGQPGFSAYVTLKPDPAVQEPETWTVFVDEFGEIAVNRATN